MQLYLALNEEGTFHITNYVNREEFLIKHPLAEEIFIGSFSGCLDLFLQNKPDENRSDNSTGSSEDATEI